MNEGNKRIRNWSSGLSWQVFLSVVLALLLLAAAVSGTPALASEEGAESGLSASASAAAVSEDTSSDAAAADQQGISEGQVAVSEPSPAAAEEEPAVAVEAGAGAGTESETGAASSGASETESSASANAGQQATSDGVSESSSASEDNASDSAAGDAEALGETEQDAASSADAVAVSLAVSIPANTITSFSDTPAGSWYLTPTNYIYWASSNGIMTGYAGTTLFGPEDPVTRGQVATVLYRASHDDDSATTDPDSFATYSRFTDVEARSYYTAAIEWCADAGIVTGDTDADGNQIGTFRPNDPVTREELATMLWRWQGRASGTVDLNAWPDGTSVSSYARDAVRWAATKGVMTGSVEPNGTFFFPQRNATRAQMAKMLYMIMNGTDGGSVGSSGTSDGESTGGSSSIQKKDLSEARVSAIPDQTYSGKAALPKPTVALGEITLVENKDYLLSYTDNVNAGTATIVITGIGGYSGQASVNFRINPVDIDSVAKMLMGLDQTYTGEAVEPRPSVILQNFVLLNEGTDYTLSYENNVNVGTAVLIMTGIGNYTGQTRVNFLIKPVDISRAAVSEVPAQIYSGQAMEPKPAVTLGGKTLAEGTDYELSYANNVNFGEATVTVTGKGNYQGTKTVSFIIRAADISKATFSPIPDQPYTGSEITPAVTVTMGGKTLSEGTDYSVSYSNNTSFGTAYVRVYGKGNYNGTKYIEFNIVFENSKYDKMEKEIIAEIITDDMTGKEKVTAIAEYVARNFDYGYTASKYVMLDKGYGDCWATTNLIIDLCKQAGIEAKERSANFIIDGSGSGHMNAIAKVDGTYYVIEASYDESQPRYYQVIEDPEGITAFGIGGSGNAEVIQYDGWGVEDLVIPEYIVNPYTSEQMHVTELGTTDSGYSSLDLRSFFYRGDSNDVKTVTIPASVESISEHFFDNETTLTAIYVAPGNTHYKSVDGVLYDMDGNLIHTPSQKK